MATWCGGCEVDLLKTFCLRLVVCIPFALGLSWVAKPMPSHPSRQLAASADAVDEAYATEPPAQAANPWAGMTDAELLRGDAEVPQ